MLIEPLDCKLTEQLATISVKVESHPHRQFIVARDAGSTVAGLDAP